MLSPSDLSITFEELRAVQACAVLMGSRVGARANYTAILKMLYLADRASLARTGLTITGCSVVNMRNGPVLSEVYNCIKGERPAQTWASTFRKEGFDIIQTRDPGDGELSDYDVKVLLALKAKHGAKHYTKLIDIVHTLPEWTNPEPSSKMRRLPLSEVLRTGHRFSDEEICEIAQRNASVVRHS